MKIEVTQEHIDKGVRKKCESCALTLALRVHFPAAVVGFANWWEDNKLHQGLTINSIFKPLPSEAIEFLQDFDNGKKVYPFTFEV